MKIVNQIIGLDELVEGDRIMHKNRPNDDYRWTEWVICRIDRESQLESFAVTDSFSEMGLCMANNRNELSRVPVTKQNFPLDGIVFDSHLNKVTKFDSYSICYSMSYGKDVGQVYFIPFQKEEKEYIKKWKLRSKSYQNDSLLTFAQSELIDSMSKLLDTRAGKLLVDDKPFLVVSIYEPYYLDVYDIISKSEIEKGTWTLSDEIEYHKKVAQYLEIHGKNPIEGLITVGGVTVEEHK